MNADILSTHTPALFDTAAQRAVELLRAGNVVALPTETVYGLAANALDARAVDRIYEIKGRPAHNPIIVHVAGVEMAERCVADWPASAGRLAAAFWPGPLTLVLPRSKAIPDVVTAGGATVGVRWSSHPFIQAVIRQCDFPLAAPSANLSSRLSPTNAEHVRRQLGGRVPLIVDGGPCQVGLESTVLDLTGDPARVLRPGMIHEESLRAVAGNIQSPASSIQDPTLRSPGLLRKHYAPNAKLIVLGWQNDTDLLQHLSAIAPHPSRCHVLAHTRIPSASGWSHVNVIPHDPEAFARALYAELHRCDEAGAEWIVVEAPPATPEWSAIADRLKRAAAT